MEEEVEGSKVGWYVGLVVAIVLVVGGFFVFRGRSAPVAAPTGYVAYTPPDNSFTCEGPAGWTSSGATSQGIAGGASFQQGDARISIVSDLTGSLAGDMSRALGGLNPQAPPPIESVHNLGSKSVEDKFSNYEETPGKPFQSSLGDARYSEFTADGGWTSGKLHGYRITMLSSERRITILCQCPERDWETLKPVFNHVIGSVQAGHS